jgi:C-terminal processing protease CtpA/Prc
MGAAIRIDRPGHLFVGDANALELRQRTRAILIGLPTGGSPNAFGEIKFAELPHSKWMVQYSTKYFQDTSDGATTVAPDIEVEPTAAEYFSGRDPVLTTALQYKP